MFGNIYIKAQRIHGKQLFYLRACQHAAMEVTSSNSAIHQEMSPEQEVLVYLQRQAIQNRIACRRQAIIQSMPVQAASTNAHARNNNKKQMDVEERSDENVISLMSSSDDEDTMDYPDVDMTPAVPPAAPAVQTATPIPVAVPAQTVNTTDDVPKTIELLWHKLKAIQLRGDIDAPKCECTECPYCSGPLMLQRHVLMERLVELEKHLWGV